MGIVFINYRRDQTAGEARALYSDLVKLVGRERVFMDVDNIALGRDFREVLRERLADCEVMLTLIGRGWCDAKDASGMLRLQQPNDFVRLEIATALQRNIAVTPLLLQDARMPAAESLPEDLKTLAFRNGFEIGHQTWESNVNELVRRLGLAEPLAPPPSPARSKAPWLVAAAASALLLIGATGTWYATRPQTQTTASSASLPTPKPVAVLPTPQPAPVLEPKPKPAQTPKPVVVAPVPTLQPVPAPAPAVDESLARSLIGDLTGTDKTTRQAASVRLMREFLQSKPAVDAAVPLLQWDRFRTLAGVPPRAQLLTFLLATDDAAWSAESRERAASGIASLREQIAGSQATFRAENVTRIEELAKRLGL